MEGKSQSIGKWILRLFIIFIAASTITIMSGALILDVPLNIKYCFNLIGVSFLMAFVICICGYLKLNMLFWTLLMGLVSGIAMMIYVYLFGEGWREVIGILDYILFYIGGLAAGGILQFIKFIYDKLRKK